MRGEDFLSTRWMVKVTAKYLGNGAYPVGVTGLHSLETAVASILQRLYAFLPPAEKPISYKHISKSERNQRIINAHEHGDTLEEIAADFGISHQRVHQIILRWANAGGGA